MIHLRHDSRTVLAVAEFTFHPGAHARVDDRRLRAGWPDRFSMLVIRNQGHFDAVVKFAKDNNLYDIDPDKPDVLSLGRSLAQLERFTRTAADGEVLVRVVLSPDFAPHSFGFAVETKTDAGWCELLSGAAIYHGAHDGGGSGGAPTFSVSLTPVKGWAIHT